MDIHKKQPYSAIDGCHLTLEIDMQKIGWSLRIAGPGAPDICPPYQMSVTPLNTIPFPFHMLR